MLCVGGVVWCVGGVVWCVGGGVWCVGGGVWCVGGVCCVWVVLCGVWVVLCGVWVVCVEVHLLKLSEHKECLTHTSLHLSIHNLPSFTCRRSFPRDARLAGGRKATWNQSRTAVVQKMPRTQPARKKGWREQTQWSPKVCVCVTSMLSRSQGTGEVHACKKYMYVCAE